MATSSTTAQSLLFCIVSACAGAVACSSGDDDPSPTPSGPFEGEGDPWTPEAVVGPILGG